MKLDVVAKKTCLPGAVIVMGYEKKFFTIEFYIFFILFFEYYIPAMSKQ